MRPRWRSATGSGRVSSRSRRVGADNESPEEADEVARVARSIVEAGARWVEREGRAAPGDLGRGPDRRALQRPGRRDQAAAAAGGPRRDRRQVPGPGGPGQHLLDDDVHPGAGAARHGLPLFSRNRLNVATSRARCITIVAASPDLLRVRAGRRRRCGSPMRSAGMSRWRPRDQRPRRRRRNCPRTRRAFVRC